MGDPAFNKTMINKEINAVNSEHQKNLNSDSWREMQLIRSIANNRSTFSSFHTGSNIVFHNLTQTYLHDQIVEMYNKYYTPQNMKLVVLSNKPITELESMVDSLFSKIRSNDANVESNLLSKRTYDIFPFDKNNIGKIIWYKKVQSGQVIKMVFYCNSLLSSFLKSKPSQILKYILSYTGPNSYLKYLKNEKLAISIDVDDSENFRSYSLIFVEIELTKLGSQYVNKVIESFFYYLNFIKRNFKTFAKKAQMDLKEIFTQNFYFKEKSASVGRNLATLANYMFDCPYNKILSYQYIIKEHDLQDYNTFIDFIQDFSPNNAIIIIGTDSEMPKNVKSNYFTTEGHILNEKWYKTVHQVSKLKKKQINNLNLFPKTYYENTFGARDKNVYISKLHHVVSPSTCKIKERKSYTENYFMKKRISKSLTALRSDNLCSIYEYFNNKNGLDQITPSVLEEGKNVKVWYKVNYYNLKLLNKERQQLQNSENCYKILISC